MMKKPIVILSCDIDEEQRLRQRQEYFQAVADAGGIPVVMPPFVERSKIEEWLDAVAADALLLTGGADIDPQFFREMPHPQLGRVSLQRDVYEAELFDAALCRKLPIMGICRGLQLINVALGGSLYQDMPSQMGDEFAIHQQTNPTEQPVHQVAFTPGSMVERLFGTSIVATNSHHHQCVHIVADCLSVSGTSVDGVVEALEWQEKNVVAVQFHPERMTDSMPCMADFFRRWVADIPTTD